MNNFYIAIEYPAIMYKTFSAFENHRRGIKDPNIIDYTHRVYYQYTSNRLNYFSEDISVAQKFNCLLECHEMKDKLVKEGAEKYFSGKIVIVDAAPIDR